MNSQHPSQSVRRSMLRGVIAAALACAGAGLWSCQAVNKKAGCEEFLSGTESPDAAAVTTAGGAQPPCPTAAVCVECNCPEADDSCINTCHARDGRQCTACKEARQPLFDKCIEDNGCFVNNQVDAACVQKSCGAVDIRGCYYPGFGAATAALAHQPRETGE
ncbi:MAG: hypothetical protein GMKNLPBB_00655 [Myxococcota bacterium]|nr:hypothetical protein [Myxococcota bacterium]